MADPLASAGTIATLGEDTLCSALPLVAAFNLRGGGDAFHDAVVRLTGAALPREANRFVETAGVTAVWLGPDEWLLLDQTADGEDLETRWGDDVAQSGGAITDVTGNRTAIRVSGPRARETLSAGCSLDLHPRAFATGHSAQTLLARTGVILLQRDDAPTFDLLVRRSFGVYLTEWMRSVADVAQRS